MKKALCLATLGWLLLPAAGALAIPKPAPGAAPEPVRHAGPGTTVLVAGALLALIAVGAVVLWIRSSRQPR